MMTMDAYYSEIAHGASKLIPIIWDEHPRLCDLEREVAKLAHVVQDNYRRSELVAMQAENPDDVMMATGMQWANYFGPDKKLHIKSSERCDLADQLAARAFSISSLAGALLQIAKQGISLAHGGYGKCPNGRAIGRQCLKDVIWQGRNQAVHWEEGTLHASVESFFKMLADDIDQEFANYRHQNMAFRIVKVLGWSDINNFKTDLLSLA